MEHHLEFWPGSATQGPQIGGMRRGGKWNLTEIIVLGWHLKSSIFESSFEQFLGLPGAYLNE